MKKIMLAVGAIAAATVVASVPSAASAQSGFSISIGSGYPGYYQSYDPSYGYYDQGSSYYRDPRSAWIERQQWERQRRWEQQRQWQLQRYREQQRQWRYQRHSHRHHDDDGDEND